jgi:hypothetical protein
MGRKNCVSILLSPSIPDFIHLKPEDTYHTGKHTGDQLIKGNRGKFITDTYPRMIYSSFQLLVLSLLSLRSLISPLSSPRFRSRFNHLYIPANFYSAVRDHGRGFEYGRFHSDCNGKDCSQGACSSYWQHGSLHLNYRRHPDQ